MLLVIFILKTFIFLANSTEVNNLFNSAASQLAAAGYPYIYEGTYLFNHR